MPRSGRFAVLAAECALAPALFANSVPVQVGSQAGIRNKVVINDGFVIGSIYDSTQRNPIYPRIDIGGTCRWDQSAQCWTPLLVRAPHEDLNGTGVESIAIDPVNPHILHLAVDAYALDRALNSAIYRAADGGSEHCLLNLTNQYVLEGPYPSQVDDWDMAATTALTPEAIAKPRDCPKNQTLKVFDPGKWLIWPQNAALSELQDIVRKPLGSLTRVLRQFLSSTLYIRDHWPHKWIPAFAGMTASKRSELFEHRYVILMLDKSYCFV